MNKSVKKKKKKKVMSKINGLESSKRRPSQNYKDLDYETELIYRMDNQEFKNLHKLDNYKLMIDRSNSRNSGSFIEPLFYRSYTEAYKTDSEQLKGE